jgi:protein PhnA
MTAVEKSLRQRSGDICELCDSATDLQVYNVPPFTNDPEKSILVCSVCSGQLHAPEKMNADHWRCLNTSMWSTVSAVQVVAWRLLHSLRNEGWPQDLLDMLYLEDDTLAWAKEGVKDQSESGSESEEKIVHRDSNGTVLQTGDTVTLIKDLEVKGAGFTAKRGTPVRGITLVEGNEKQIEGKVNGQQIVILTQFVRRG